MKSLVTGGAGFIGSNIVDRLIELNHDVLVIDNESSESHDMFYYNNKAIYYKLDICDYENTRSLYNGIDYVFHLAAESRIQPTIINPILAVKTNVLGTATVLQCSKESGVKRVVYSTTSSYYGLKNTVPNIETQVEDCLNPYSVSKVSGDKLCKMYYDLYGLETIILRYFNVYGDRHPTRGQYAPVIGLFLRQNIDGKKMTIVGDGSQKRDFTNVKDVVNANILAALSSIDSEHFGTAFNIGSGNNYSILEIANMIDNKKYEFIPSRPGEAKETLANIEKVKSVLGWKPEISLEKWIKGYAES